MADIQCPECGTEADEDDFACSNCQLILNAMSATGSYSLTQPSIVRALLSPTEFTGVRPIPKPPPPEQIHEQITVRGAVLMDEHTVPKLTAGLDVALQPLLPFEAQVASFLDGRTSVPEVARLAHLSAVETHAILTSLLQRRVIELHRRDPEAAKKAKRSEPAPESNEPAEQESTSAPSAKRRSTTASLPAAAAESRNGADAQRADGPNAAPGARRSTGTSIPAVGAESRTGAEARRADAANASPAARRTTTTSMPATAGEARNGAKAKGVDGANANGGARRSTATSMPAPRSPSPGIASGERGDVTAASRRNTTSTLPAASAGAGEADGDKAAAPPPMKRRTTTSSIPAAGIDASAGSGDKRRPTSSSIPAVSAPPPLKRTPTQNAAPQIAPPPLKRTSTQNVPAQAAPAAPPRTTTQGMQRVAPPSLGDVLAEVPTPTKPHLALQPAPAALPDEAADSHRPAARSAGNMARSTALVDPDANVLEKAIALEREGDVGRAIDTLKRAIAKAKEPAPIYNKLALILLDQRKDYRQAEELLAQAVDLDPSNPVYQQNLHQVQDLIAQQGAAKPAGLLGKLLGRKER